MFNLKCGKKIESSTMFGGLQQNGRTSDEALPLKTCSHQNLEIQTMQLNLVTGKILKKKK
jgi:hypothetical protein